jgi:hypothetical protein
MIKWLTRLIFMDKRAREAAAKIHEAQPRLPPEDTVDVAVASEPDDEVSVQGEKDGTADPEDRAALIQQTMALYRQRRGEYEQLDEGVRNKLTKLASDALIGKGTSNKGKKAE